MNSQDLSSSHPSRRRLLALIGAGGAAFVAALMPRGGTRAGHGVDDGADALHLARENTTEAATELFAHIPTGPLDDPVALAVAVDQGRGISGSSEYGVGLWGQSFGGEFPNHPIVGVEGVGHQDGVGVRGRSNPEPGAPGFGAGAGVEGESGGGPGVRGRSQTGPGVSGHSDTGPGGTFHTEGGDFAANIGGSAVEFALGVDNGLIGEGAGGIFSISRGGKPAIEGDALDGEFGAGVGVQGVSGTNETFGQGPGVGVQGISGTGIGVQAISAEGMALDVAGKARFSTVGTATVPAGQESILVRDATATTASHIMVTLVGDPGARGVRWVSRAGGAFTVHLTSAPANKRPATPFTYLIVEPG
jgi:hypothetical protein